MNEQKTMVPTWFWVVAVIALLWNLMGLAAFAVQIGMTDEMITKQVVDKTITAELGEIYRNMPGWVNIAFGVATICGTLGCVALLMRKKWAIPLFLLSIIGVVVQNGYSFLNIDVMKHFGAIGYIMPVLVVIIGVCLIMFSKSSATKRWLS